MVTTGRLREMILEKATSRGITEQIAQGFDNYGMQTFDQSLLALYEEGVITRRDALATATKTHDLRLKMDASDLAKAHLKEASARV